MNQNRNNPPLWAVLFLIFVCVLVLAFTYSWIVPKPADAAPASDPILYTVKPGFVEVICYGCGFTDPPSTSAYIQFHRIGEDFEQLIWLQYGSQICPGGRPPCYDAWYAFWYPPPAQYLFEYGQIDGAPAYKVIQGLPTTITIYGTWWPTIFQSTSHQQQPGWQPDPTPYP